MDLTTTPVIFIDYDGTLTPELPAVRMMMQFSAMAMSRKPAANRHLRRLINRGAKLVWNSRNPDPVMRPRGRLHSFNGRYYGDPAAEYIRIRNNAGLEDSDFLPGHPEIVHCAGMTKGRSMAALCMQLGIPLHNTVAFDNEIEQMTGYPAEQVIPVNSLIGIDRAGHDIASLKLAHILLPLKTDPSGTPPRIPPQP